MKLILGSSYLLYTKPVGVTNSFYVGIKVSVDSTLTYSEVNKLYPNELRSTMGYHGIDEDIDPNKQFYKCSYLNEPDDIESQYMRKVYIVWDDIIDETLTTRLDATYSCRLNFKILTKSDGTTWTEKDLNTALAQFLLVQNSENFSVSSEYGNGVDTFVAEINDPESDIYMERDDLEKKLADAERTIDSLNLLKQSADKTVKDLYSLNVSSTVTEIYDTVSVINEKVNIIESNLR